MSLSCFSLDLCHRLLTQWRSLNQCSAVCTGDKANRDGVKFDKCFCVPIHTNRSDVSQWKTRTCSNCYFRCLQELQVYFSKKKHSSIPECHFGISVINVGPFYTKNPSWAVWGFPKHWTGAQYWAIDSLVLGHMERIERFISIDR